MKLLYSLFSLCLLLFAVACSKDKADPQPDLMGRWDAQYTLRIGYDSSGQKTGEDNIPDKTFYMVLTQDSISYHFAYDGSTLATSAYSRQGSTIQYDNARGTVTELTDHKLAIRFIDINKSPGRPYQEEELHFTR